MEAETSRQQIEYVFGCKGVGGDSDRLNETLRIEKIRMGENEMIQ
jgi:hypothetical protein